METPVSTKDYTCSFTVSVNTGEVFRSLTSGLAAWWTNSIEGSAQKLNDVFTVHFGTTHKTMKVTDVIPDETVVWKCIDAYIDLPDLKDKSEWVGSKMVWEIVADGNHTKVTMTHLGLNPEIECYDVCEKGWGFFLKESLYRLLTTGTGLPYTKI